jgi:hypothetical protein
VVCELCQLEVRTPIVVDPPVYSFLLAAYLGDGSIVRVNSRSRSMRLSITLDDAYPAVQDAVELACSRVLPEAARRRDRKPGCHDVVVSHLHLPCLFPQHGPGRKHERRIVLEPWQSRVVEAHPWEFLRGAFYTDGCSYTNWTVSPAGRRYEYLTYAFSNRSEEIHQLVCGAARDVGLRPSRHGKNVVFARRPDVLRLEAHVGRKSALDVAALASVWDTGSAWHQSLDAGRIVTPLRRVACADCGEQISRGARRCKSCAGRVRETPRAAWPPFDQLALQVSATSKSAVARSLGVSEAAVRKRLKRGV